MTPTRRAALAGVGAALGALAGCQAPAGGDPTPSPGATPTDAGPDHVVSLRGVTGAARLSPVGLALAPGETVAFAVEGGPHSTRAYHPDNGTERRIPAGAEPWASPVLSAGQSFAVTLTVEGTYDYYCATHVAHGQVGRLVVGQPGGPAAGSSPPDGEVPDGATVVEEGRVPAEG